MTAKIRTEGLTVVITRRWRQLAGIALTLPLLTAAGDVTYPEMEEALQQYRINEDYDPEAYQRLVGLLTTTLEQMRAIGNHSAREEDDLRRTHLKPCRSRLPKKVCEHLIVARRKYRPEKIERRAEVKLLKYALAELKGTDDFNEQSYAFLVGKNILYNIFAEYYEGRSMRASEVIGTLKKFKTKLPYLGLHDRMDRLDEDDAKKEAVHLVDTSSPTPRRFLSAEEIAGRSHDKVSKLDVRDDHHLWFPEEFVDKTPHLWARFERFWEDQITAGLIKEDKRLAAAKSFHYDLKTSHRVVFFEEARIGGGTHPKIRVSDPFGLDWKLKWGDEYFSEAVANRLYVTMGGKFEDLNYTHALGDPVIVVFGKVKPKKDAAEDSPPIHSFSELESFINENYSLNLSHYLHRNDQGLIDESNIDSLLARVPQPLQDLTELRERILGRHYVIFNEASVELKDKSLPWARGGPFAQSTLGSENDRAMRGLILFHMWIDNFDAKDANGEGLLAGTFANPAMRYLQSPTDLGAGFRGSGYHGWGLNHFDTEDFLERGFFSRKSVTYPRLLVYRSEAGKRATYADIAWMARKIAKVSRAVMHEVIDPLPLPGFFKEVLIYKLLARRNKIASLYFLNDYLDTRDLAVPNVTFDLSSEAAIEKAAAEVGVPAQLLKAAKLSAKMKMNEPLLDVVVEKGKIAKCHESLIVNVIEREFMPTGMSRNLSKSSEAPGKCIYKK